MTIINTETMEENPNMIYGDTNREIEQEEEEQLIHSIFGDHQNFHICIDSKDLDKVISTNTDIIIKNKYNCYCYCNHNRPNDYFHIRSDLPHTYKSIIKELIKQDFEPFCNHIFLESINKVNDCTYELFMGS